MVHDYVIYVLLGLLVFLCFVAHLHRLDRIAISLEKLASCVKKTDGVPEFDASRKL